MESYPKFYKKGSICIKRESDTFGDKVEMPETYKTSSTQHVQISVHNKQTFDRLIDDMEKVSKELYDIFLFIHTHK